MGRTAVSAAIEWNQDHVLGWFDDDEVWHERALFVINAARVRRVIHMILQAFAGRRLDSRPSPLAVCKLQAKGMSVESIAKELAVTEESVLKALKVKRPGQPGRPKISNADRKVNDLER